MLLTLLIVVQLAHTFLIALIGINMGILMTKYPNPTPKDIKKHSPKTIIILLLLAFSLSLMDSTIYHSGAYCPSY